MTARAAEGQPTDVSGDAGITLDGGGGGHLNDNLSLTAKTKTGDYAAGNGSKLSLELGWGGGSHGSSDYHLGLAGDFATNADGEVETTLTQDEFNIDADSGGGGNDWFRVKYDSKAHLVTDTTEGYWAYHNETDSTNHAEVKLESDGNSSFLLGIVKPTGGEATGSIDLTFDGSVTDEWHIHDKSVNTWDDFYDDGSGSTDRRNGKATDKYDLDEVFTSSYDGNSSAVLNADGTVTGSGLTHYEEDYTFDQVSQDDREYDDETTLTTENSGGGPDCIVESQT